MQRPGGALLCKGWGGHFYANARVGTHCGEHLVCKHLCEHFDAKAGVDTLCKRWGGHFYAKAGVGTFVQTLWCTPTGVNTSYANTEVDTFMQRMRWALYRKAGVDTFMQRLGWALLCKR